MIILDTNVISDLMKPDGLCDPRVASLLDEQVAASIYTTAITVAEVFAGLAIMPGGKRRNRSHATARRIFEHSMNGRILAFDKDAALVFADVLAERRAAGRPIADMDALILSITRTHGAALAKRNVRDFAESGVMLVNPRTDAP